MKLKLSCFLVGAFLFLGSMGFAQTVAFDQINSNVGSSKSITWTTSIWGSGFGHRILNADPGEYTTLNFQVRNNSATWKNAMIITSTGNVGIGLNNPLHPFHVSSLNDQRSRFQFGGTAIDLVDYSTYSEGFSNSAGMFISGKDALIMSSQGYNLRFVTNESGAFMERMRIMPNGNVGVGVTNPTSKLEVNGTIKTKEVNVTTSGWADYVFKSDYDLRPLSEVESFITKNGHLPNVPSEKEVLENGVNLLEMNVKLLEKVEELTLHLIEQQKQINLLKKEVFRSSGKN